MYTGFDSPETLGKKETGSSVAVPIFRDFVSKYYEEKPILPFTIPKGIELIRIDYDTGKVAKNMQDVNDVYEAFTKSDNLAINDQTLVGSQGFQIIEIEEDITEEYLIY